MSLTREELQNAGANPELARILADRWPRRGPGDLTHNPMAVTLAGIALAAFLSTLAWFALGLNGVQTDVELLKQGQLRIEDRMTGLEDRMTGLEDRMSRIEDRMSRIEDRMSRIDEKLDQLLQK